MANPRVSLHLTPSSCSWPNMVEIFFGIVTRPWFKRGTFDLTKDLEEAMECYIESYNADAKPLVWTKPSKYLPGKVKRQQTINTSSAKENDRNHPSFV